MGVYNVSGLAVKLMSIDRCDYSLLMEHAGPGIP